MVIATGSGAAFPPISGLEEIAPWTNRAGTTSMQVPKRLTVLGGGVVGCELGQAWSTLGAGADAGRRLVAKEPIGAVIDQSSAATPHVVDLAAPTPPTAATTPAPAAAPATTHAASRDRGSARRTALWQLGVMTPGRRVPGGTQLALPLDLPAPPSLRPAVGMGADARRLRHDRADDADASDGAAA